MFNFFKSAFNSAKNWTFCCTTLLNEFGLNAEKSPDLGSVRKLWTDLTEKHSLTQTASVSLFYRLIFLNYLAAFSILQKSSNNVTSTESIIELIPLLDRSVDYSELSEDSITLEIATSHLNKSIELMLDELGIKRGDDFYYEEDQKEELEDESVIVSTNYFLKPYQKDYRFADLDWFRDMDGIHCDALQEFYPNDDFTDDGIDVEIKYRGTLYHIPIKNIENYIELKNQFNLF